MIPHDVFTEISVVSAVIGAIVASATNGIVGLFSEKKKEKRLRTEQFAREYLDLNYIPIRAAVYEITQLISSGEISLGFVAAGYWFPGDEESFTGKRDEVTGLNQHELLTVELAFYKRLGYAISKNLVDKRDLDLLSDLIWSADLIHDLCNEIERQAIQAGNGKPHWLKYVRKTLNVVPSDYSGSRLSG
ncbi:MAG: hypothetical protein Q4D85_14355 [Corynebacterium sp.]|uniref:hypothetical protein n=1 Tax=Corynebacterium sp. TaxID=1720 RepID=UPI0026DCB6C1|nr:hypothetical protein [Corynebacterium sp.]MDO5099916.1 hypothetical protein [Corynebacterium sp.]